MEPEQMDEGLRVRTTHVIDIFPVMIVPAGILGTVIDVRTGQDPFCHVQLDQHFPQLDEWENCLQVFLPHDAGCGCTSLDFEPAIGFV